MHGLWVGPAMVIGLGEPVPPNIIANAQHPRRLDHGPPHQPVAPFWFRVYSGSGLVIQGLTRFPATPNRRRASRMVLSLTSLGVNLWAKLTSAASASVHRLVGLSNVRGLWCNSTSRGSQVPASKRANVVWGRRRLGLQHGEAALVKRLNGVAHRLVGGAQVAPNGGGRLLLGTGEESLAAAYGQGGRRPHTGRQGSPLVHRERAHIYECLPTPEYTTCLKTSIRIAISTTTKVMQHGNR
jgi:hypothetical protein